MPDFPIVDTHVHLWDPKSTPIDWIKSIPSLNRSYLPADLHAARGQVQLDFFIFLECGVASPHHLKEAHWVAERARSEPRLKGMVASAPLEKGDAVEPDLAELASIPLVRGIRRLLQDEPVDFCLQPDFIAGIKRLPAHGLHFEICIYHRHLENVLAMVRQCPEVTFILDHIGKPGIRDGLVEPWRAHIRELAQYENVHCKMSGVVTEADHSSWTPEQIRPYLDHVLACFGFDRVMYGSDWPVATLATAYPHWVETLDEALAGCSADELRKFWRDNAARFYRPG